MYARTGSQDDIRNHQIEKSVVSNKLLKGFFNGRGF